MNTLIVYAHDEPTSFTAAMKNAVVDVLSHQGHSVVVSDLYGQGFSAVAQKWDFVTTSGHHFNYMLEQRHAANLDLAFSPDILAEIQKLRAAELVIFVTPIWWLSVPAILKGWFDRVLAMGFAWNSGKIYETGLLRGKSAMVIGTAGGPEEFFHENGRYRATPVQVLHHVNHGILAYCGMDVYEPFMALNILGSTQADLENVLKELRFRMEHVIDNPQWLIHF